MRETVVPPDTRHGDVLAGKTAVITGGTKGLGRCIAEGFLRAGANVVCTSRRDHDIKELLDEFEGRAAFFASDLRDEESIERVFLQAEEKFGGLDIVVANAGITRNGTVDNLGAADWRAVMDTNVNGVFHTVRHAIRHLPPGTGNILTVSAAMVNHMVRGATAYITSKSAVEAFTRASAIDISRHGLRINCLAPGIISAGMGEVVMADDRLWQRYEPHLLAGRAGAGHEVAAAATFLVSGAASYINGHVLEVSGGVL